MATWEFIDHEFTLTSPKKYAARMVEQAKSSGASQQQIDQTVREAEQFQRNYHKAAYNIAITFLEVFPVLFGNHAVFGRDPAKKIRACVSVTICKKCSPDSASGPGVAFAAGRLSARTRTRIH